MITRTEPWHWWFAWRPVRTQDWRWTWLMTIKRRRAYWRADVYTGSHWQYEREDGYV